MICDKRSHSRFDVKHQFSSSLCLSKGSDERVRLKVFDLSRDGLKLELPSDVGLKAGQKVEVWLNSMRFDAVNVMLNVNVKWVDGSVCGGEFCELSERSVFYLDYICSMLELEKGTLVCSEG